MNFEFSTDADGMQLHVRSVRSRFLPEERVDDRPHKHFFSEFHCVFRGEEIIDFPKENRKIHVKAGQILFIPRDHYHGVTTAGETVDRICFHFSAEKADAPSPFSEQSLRPTLFRDDYAKGLMELCRSEQLLPPTPQGKMRQGFLMISTALRLLSDGLTRESKEQALEAPDKKWIILDYMERHFTDPEGLEGLAKALYLSQRQTSTLVKKYLGADFKTAIRQRRMELADIYLQRGELSLEEIAWNVGYRSYSGFQLSFKEYFGATPSARRKQLATADQKVDTSADGML